MSAAHAEPYDVIILGAGPGGLALAAELAPKARVLVIEKNPIGHTTATWYSYADRVREHGLDDAVLFRTPHILFQSPNFAHHLQDDCVVLDHHQVLATWHQRATAGGAEFVQGTYLAHRTGTHSVVVSTSTGSYRTRLLVDCTGPRSPIVKAHGLIRRCDTWILWGARVRLAEPLEKPGIEYLPLNDAANTYFGLHPFSASEVNVYVFRGQHGTLGEPRELEAIFEAELARRYPGAEKVEFLGGSIVSGILKKDALTRVAFFGAAGMMNPDAIGMGFNEILRQVRTYAAGLARALHDDHLDAKTLSEVARSVRDPEVLHFQRIIGAFSLHFIGSPTQWDGGVKWLNALGTESRHWMRNELTLDWIRQATLKLHQAVPLKDSLRMIPFKDSAFILEQLGRFAVKSVARGLGARRRAA